jgi:hypothetical protein
MISPSAAALSSLRTHGLDDDLIRVATTMAEEIHAAADDGLVRLGVGVLASSTEWSWNIRLYDRYASDEGAEVDDQRVAYDQLPEPELPELAPRQRERSDHAAK